MTQFQPANSVEEITDVDLKRGMPSGFRSVRNMTLGLSIEKVAPNGPSIADIITEIKKMDFGRTTQADDKWDCEERAIWGMFHIRHKFPGCPVGIAEGKATVGSINNLDHAVLVLWDKEFKHQFVDPAQVGKAVTFSEIVRIFALPTAADNQPDAVELLKKLNLPRLKDNQYINHDAKYWIYPKTTDARNGVIDYLWNAFYEKDCPNIDKSAAAHDEVGDTSYWKAADTAFWAFAHVRRVFEGCAIGVAFGTPKKEGITKAVNIILTKNGNKIEPIYWDALPQNKKIVDVADFTPNKIFF